MSDPGRILAVDYGDKRTGLAICEESGRIVTPYQIIIETVPKLLAEKVAVVAKTENVDLVILGLPLDMDGRSGNRAIKTETFGKMLMACLGEMPMKYQDERLTSFSAERLLASAGVSARKMKGRVDAIAACEILRAYLSEHFPASQENHAQGAADLPWEKPSFNKGRRKRQSPRNSR